MPVTPQKPLFQILHQAACRNGEAGYLDPETGYFVMSSIRLLEQGECCGNGCRHCPYPPEEQHAAQRPNQPAYPYVVEEEEIKKSISSKGNE